MNKHREWNLYSLTHILQMLFSSDRPTVKNISPLTRGVPPNSPYTVTAQVSGGTPLVQDTDILWSTAPITQGFPSFNGSVASLHFSNLTSPVLVTLTVQHPSGNRTLLFYIPIQRECMCVNEIMYICVRLTDHQRFCVIREYHQPHSWQCGTLHVPVCRRIIHSFLNYK